MMHSMMAICKSYSKELCELHEEFLQISCQIWSQMHAKWSRVASGGAPGTTREAGPKKGEQRDWENGDLLVPLGRLWAPFWTQLGAKGVPKSTFWEPFSWKIYGQNRCENISLKCHGKLWKIYAKLKRLFYICWKVSSWKNIFFEKGVVVYTLAGCSRMRVGEGSQEKNKSET